MSRLVSPFVCLLFGLTFGAFAQEVPKVPQAEPGITTGLAKPEPQKQLLPLDTSTADELEAQGDDLRAQNMFLDAIDSYKAAIRKKPTAALYNKLGIAYIFMRRPLEAEQALGRAIKMDKNYADAWNNRGSAYFSQGDYRRAAKEFEKAVKISQREDIASIDDSNRATYHCNLGSAYFNRKNMEKATREYQIALKLDPFVFERSSRRGVAAMMGKPSTERAEFEYLMAKLWAQSGDPVKCLLHLRKALEEGYKDINNVYKDQEFATVRGDQRFKDLMAQKPEGIQQ